MIQKGCLFRHLYVLVTLERKIKMKYERAVMEILLWEDEVLPITQVSESVDGQFGDLDADGLPEEE